MAAVIQRDVAGGSYNVAIDFDNEKFHGRCSVHKAKVERGFHRKTSAARLVACSIVMVCVYCGNSCGQIFGEKITPDSSGNGSFVGDGFGASVAISGNALLVGAPHWNDDANDSEPGEVYFVAAGPEGTHPSHQIRPSLSVQVGDSRIGTSVAMGGNLAAIGAAAIDQVFVGNIVHGFAGSLASLARPNPNLEFGFAVDVVATSGNGGHFVVGAPTDNSSLKGEVFVGEVQNGSPQPVFSLKRNPSDVQLKDRFGHSVAISSNYVIVGAPTTQVPNTGVGSDMLSTLKNAGAAYVFRYDDENDQIHQEFRLDVAQQVNSGIVRLPGDQFGFSVDIDEQGIALVGAPISYTATSSGGNVSGAAYLFDLNNCQNGICTQLRQLAPETPMAAELFGSSVAIVGSLAVVGAANGRAGLPEPTIDPVPAGEGAVYVFDIATGNQLDKFTAAQLGLDQGNNSGDAFGAAVAGDAANHRLIVGAVQDSEQGPLAGAAYLLSFENASWNPFPVDPPVDIDEVCAAVAQGNSAGRLDVNGDDLVDLLDVAEIANSMGRPLGDFDGNGHVAFPDFLRLSRNFIKPGTWSDGDLNCNGTVDFPDFLRFVEHFRNSQGNQQAAAVPEPETWLSLATLFALLIPFLRKSRRRMASVTPRHTLIPLCVIFAQLFVPGVSRGSSPIDQESRFIAAKLDIAVQDITLQQAYRELGLIRINEARFDATINSGNAIKALVRSTWCDSRIPI